MEICLEASDIYFRRSFCPERNARLFPGQHHKMHPLGFNYHVTCRDNPLNESRTRAAVKALLGRTPDARFTPEVFEGTPRQQDRPPRILFLARLWDDHEPGFSAEENAERTYINTMRIEIIRALRARYGRQFIGGLNDNALSQAWAPELIVPAKYTERGRYLRLLHDSDICIGSMGLFESIGWKTGEYVAAAKAIVNERLHFTVPGDFREGSHYLPFDTARECIDAVEALVQDPARRFAMQQANRQYYQAYLRPDVLVKNTLDIARRELQGK